MQKDKRRFIRHPSDIPIEIFPQGQTENYEGPLNDVSIAGLSFNTNVYLSKDTEITIRMPMFQPPFEITATVMWCRESDHQFDIGVAFMDVDEAVEFRIVEQVCYIEHYKRKAFKIEGRKLTTEEAAREWIAKYSSRFTGEPPPDDL